jgi:hypothetical protein
MILKKVALPLTVDGKSYWEAMILAIANNKICSLRANFMQELFEQFQSKFYSISVHLNDLKAVGVVDVVISVVGVYHKYSRID